jgi:manganese/iron transport system ATP-binding protein
METDVPALDLDEITVAYGTALAIEDIDGMVAPGEAVALIGPNGAGKSTLIKAVLGLVPLVSGGSACSAGHRPRLAGTWRTSLRPTRSTRSFPSL